MYSVRNITKVYKSNNNETKALNGVSFDLPEKGLIFVVGKSGSGKSTLLNILAGLDKATSGEVIYKDKDIEKFSQSDLDSYRNTEIGFIFQNNLLIDRKTIKKNLQLTLDLKNEKNEGIIEETLDKIEMGDLINRYPGELSAGQLERAAIARALVKNPNVLFADEPTGNLDSKTSKIILDIFKELSRERLIVVISHNISNANEYGDRIIEIADGFIVSDKTRISNDKDELIIDGANIQVPYDNPLSSDDTFTLNNAISENKGNVFISKRPSNFINSSYKHETSEYEPIKNHLSFFRLLKSAFDGISIFQLVIFLVSLSLLFLLIGSAEGFMSFSPLKQMAEEQKKASFNLNGGTPAEPLIFYRSKGYKDDGTINKEDALAIKEEDLNRFSEMSGGVMYKVYNFAPEHASNMHHPARYRIYNQECFSRTEGPLIQCDYEFLKELFGDENGNVNVLAGEISESSIGIIITDFWADIMVERKIDKVKSYEDIIGRKTFKKNKHIYTAIIETGYKTNEKVQYLLNNINNLSNDEYIENADLINGVISYLCSAYTINPNWKEDYLRYRRETKEDTSIFNYKLTMRDANETGYEPVTSTSHLYFNTKLPMDSASIGEVDFFKLFPESELRFTEDVTNIRDLNLKIKVDYYDSFGICMSGEYYINDVNKNNTDGRLYLGTKDEDGISHLYDEDFIFTKYLEYTIQPMGFIINHAETPIKLDEYIIKGEDPLIFELNIKGETLQKGYEVLISFKTIFILFDVFFIVLLVSIEVFSILSMVMKKKKEMGVIRAIGGRMSDLTLSLVIQILLITIFTIIVSIIVYSFGINATNSIITLSLEKMNHMPYFKEITIVSFNIKHVIINSSIILLSSIIASIIPLIIIRGLNPIAIIRSKED